MQAPFRERRELIFRAVELHADIVKTQFTNARLWLDGGFVTHKTWAAPEDADVVVIVPEDEFPRVASDEILPLWSLLGVSAGQPSTTTGKLHPMGGLMDVFFQPDNDIPLAVWDDRWSSVNDEHGNLVDGARKGYLEVIL